MGGPYPNLLVRKGQTPWKKEKKKETTLSQNHGNEPLKVVSKTNCANHTERNH